jgi:hypothetical protein
MTATFLTVSIITLLSCVAGIIASRIRRAFTRDIRIVFNTGQSVTLPVKPEAREYQVRQKIVNAVDEVLFPQRRSVFLSANSKEMFAAPPTLSKIKLLETERVQGIDKLRGVSPRATLHPDAHPGASESELHLAIVSEYVGKIERSKHVETRHFHKETKRHRDRPIRLENRTRSDGWRDRSINRAKTGEWMRKHSEEVSLGAK